MRADWQELIPHGGAMCLLERVSAWDEEHIHAQAVSHRDPAHPLRCDGLLRAVHLCEYAAQAMAVHGGLCARRDGLAPRPGWLVALRAVKLHVARIDDLPGPLDVHAEQLLADTAGWQYAFRIEHAGAALAQGRASVMTPGSGLR